MNRNKRLLTVTSGEFERETGLHICTNHTGKMKGMWSLSTSPLNPICEARSRDPESICSKCYSRNMQEMYSELSKCLLKNAEILTGRILEPDEMPKLGNKLGMFRFEAFGDATSELQIVNNFHITEANPDVHCALWTKNPEFIKRAMENYGITKPENLVIIGSSSKINVPQMDYQKYDFIDYIFTVYDKPFIAEHNIDINCGGRSCRSCKKCYLKTHTEYEIREQLK